MREEDEARDDVGGRLERYRAEVDVIWAPRDALPAANAGGQQRKPTRQEGTIDDGLKKAQPNFFTFHDGRPYAKKDLLDFLVARPVVQAVASLIPIEDFNLRLELITKTRNDEQREPLTLASPVQTAGNNAGQLCRQTVWNSLSV
ncbi:hypothetical protein NM208_g12898 [Fusarium decemcellulare]|uniref:Uncharacterized protein n=1 Tax=Fusarium decemcellulare TaxID=57161 RepID=A0ACC1RPD7_9HYPO|nr:hypothetical protein NM208_g12898 [Fusarium decemcellulare]